MLELTHFDREFFKKNLNDFIPDSIIDIHTHVWLKKDRNTLTTQQRLVTWPNRVAAENSIDDLIQTYQSLFPGKNIMPLLFSMAEENDNLDQLNNYIYEQSQQTNFPSLIFAHPSWASQELEDKIIAGNFVGAKVYLSLAPAYIPADQIRILDFIPPHQLEVLDRNGWILMLHIPRSQRLKDPVNLAQMIEIENQFPNIKLIIAHVGRAYCNDDIGSALHALANTKKMLFDFSANTNQYVFEQLIHAVGPKRILFGSDLPILRMRAKRITNNGTYINIVPPGLYGDISGEKNMREATPDEAQSITFLLYEQIMAFRLAAEKLRLTRFDIEDVFYNNASRVIDSAKPRQLQLQMTWHAEKCSQDIQLPEGFSLRTYKPGDENDYCELMKAAGFEYWNKNSVQQMLKRCLPDGLFFIVHDSTQKLVATTGATHNPTDLHPFGAELSWVAVHPDFRGKNLSSVTCAAVTQRLKSAGYSDIYLLTDDFRLAGIKTYLKLGWRPYLYTSQMKARWEKVFHNLKMQPLWR